MSQIHIPAELRQRYGSLPDTELRSLARQVLESPGKHDDKMLKHWLVALSFVAVRPPARSNVSTMQRRQWIAFALRYLEPLVTGGDEPNTRAAVLNEFNTASAGKLAALLFGAPEDAETILPTFFQRTQENDSQVFPDWQHTAIEHLRCADYSEDVIKTWSRALIEPLVSAVVQHLRPALALAAHEGVQAIRNTTERPLELYGTAFDQYLEVTTHPAHRAHHGLALGYRNEFARRQALTLTYSRAARNASILASALSIGAAWLWKGEMIGAVVPPILVMAVLLLFYTRLVNHILDTFTWARAAQETLDTLLGTASGQPAQHEQ